MNLISLKKISYNFFLVLIYYLFITAIVYSFSYISLINGKTYDLFWVKSIQKQIYFKGYRNIWQNNNECVIFDKNLLYKPKTGLCIFENPEFNTKLKFDNFKRNHNLNTNYKNEEHIIVLGDSIAMGWGVNDHETFSYHIEKQINKKVYNLAVSSYGTVREIKRLKLSPFYKNSKTIIIQYHPNDLGENKELDINNTYSKDEFDIIFDQANSNLKIYSLILGTYKSSIRLFFSDIIDIIFREKNLELIDFSNHQKFLEKILKENLNLEEKRIFIVLTLSPWQKVVNFPLNEGQIQYLLIELNKSHFFKIDEHPNTGGHQEIASLIIKKLFE